MFASAETRIRPGRQNLISRFRGNAPAILPSFLRCNFANLARELELLEVTRVAGLHMDVMDGHFVPNLTYGPLLVEAIRPLTPLPIDVHLMVTNPADLIDPMAKAGADLLTIHLEAVADPRPLFREIHDRDMMAGLAINPETPVSRLQGLLEDCDMVLVMSVHPGLGGQSFIESSPAKVAEVRRLAGPQMLIEVDGGINDSSIGKCAAAGADLHVVGSAIFLSADYRAVVDELIETASSKQSKAAKLIP